MGVLIKMNRGWQGPRTQIPSNPVRSLSKTPPACAANSLLAHHAVQVAWVMGTKLEQGLGPSVQGNQSLWLPGSTSSFRSQQKCHFSGETPQDHQEGGWWPSFCSVLSGIFTLCTHTLVFV